MSSELDGRLPGPRKTSRRKTTNKQPKTTDWVVLWSRKATNVRAIDASNPVLKIKRVGLVCIDRPVNCILEASAFDGMSSFGSLGSITTWGASGRDSFLESPVMTYSLRRQGSEPADRAPLPPRPAI